MPPRTVTWIIVAFWLATTGWLFSRDVWPRLRPGDRPPFVIDLVKEAREPGVPTHWLVHYNGRLVGFADTWVTHRREDDTYLLINKLRFESFRISLLEVRGMESRYRVTRDGELRAVSADVTFTPPIQFGVASSIKIQVAGRVEERRFTPRWTIDPPLLGQKEWTSETIEVPAHTSMLNPLQPWHRLLAVRKNQRWQMTLFDPLSDSVAASTAAAGLPGIKQGPRYLDAGVLEETQHHIWNGQDVECLVIEYRGSNLLGRTWVRASDGLVLRQEAIRYENTPQEERLVLERDKQ